MEGATSQTHKTLVAKGGMEVMNGQESMVQEVNIRDLLFVKLHRSSWWPAQVVDENTVSGKNKPSSKKSSSDVLVRLYGSYKYMYVDFHKSRVKFKKFLEENDFNHIDIMKKALEQDLPSSNYNRSRRPQSKSKGTVEMEASQNGSSEKLTSSKSQVSSKKRKQETGKPVKSLPETPKAETKNKIPKLDGVHQDANGVSSKKRKQETGKTAKSPKVKTKNKRPKLDGVHQDAEPLVPNGVSSKKNKQETGKTAKSHQETPKVKTKNKRPKLDGVHQDAEPLAPNGVSSKKNKQETGKTAKFHQETPKTKTKTKNNTPKLDGVHLDAVPPTPNDVNSSPRELSARRRKVMQSLGLMAPTGSPFPRNGLVSANPPAC